MLIRTVRKTVFVFAALVGFGVSSVVAQVPMPVGSVVEDTGNRIWTRVFESEPFVIDQIYRSMEGPKATAGVKITHGAADELFWLLSYETKIVDVSTGEVLSDEYMCHNNANFKNFEKHRKLIGAKPVRGARRLFTLSQGVMDVTFPKGFGIPFRADEPISVNTQVLNLNPIEDRLHVRYRTTVRYAVDSQLVQEITPLYQFGMMGLKLTKGEKGYPGEENPNVEHHGESCSVGEVAESGKEYPLADGNTYIKHWVVEPGREENHTLVTPRLGLTEDTKVHYIAVHLHPFAESLELRDLTAKETVFISHATNRKDSIGLKEVESYSSTEGLTLFKDHEYSLISVYDNDSGERQDAMASMFLYMLDTKFDNIR